MISIKKLILLVSVLCLSLAAAAQSESIRGTILDTDGLPVIGAAVIIQGTSVGTSTDLGVISDDYDFIHELGIRFQQDIVFDRFRDHDCFGLETY